MPEKKSLRHTARIEDKKDVKVFKILEKREKKSISSMMRPSLSVFLKRNVLWYEILPFYFLLSLMIHYCWLTILEKTKLCQSSKATVYVQTLSRENWASIAHQMPFLTPHLNSRDPFNWK